ncbi:hypothetical protein GDO86_019824 [Hymenochirus boettgeri]|uniref:Uncharacterized protein n=1 Tax=Hymenochirus boettgeri TaxID=247094 RepID=A0A8T2INW8_9PIPI|nr:hypothetical protein GDO86_019824 [Hymenochirus boettgeri]
MGASGAGTLVGPSGPTTTPPRHGAGDCTLLGTTQSPHPHPRERHPTPGPPAPRVPDPVPQNQKFDTTHVPPAPRDPRPSRPRIPGTTQSPRHPDQSCKLKESAQDTAPLLSKLKALQTINSPPRQPGPTPVPTTPQGTTSPTPHTRDRPAPRTQGPDPVPPPPGTGPQSPPHPGTDPVPPHPGTPTLVPPATQWTNPVPPPPSGRPVPPTPVTFPGIYCGRVKTGELTRWTWATHTPRPSIHLHPTTYWDLCRLDRHVSLSTVSPCRRVFQSEWTGNQLYPAVGHKSPQLLLTSPLSGEVSAGSRSCDWRAQPNHDAAAVPALCLHLPSAAEAVERA